MRAESPLRITADALRGSLQRHDRQMLAPAMVVQFDRESITRLASDKRLRLGASRTARPAPARFDAWFVVGGSLAEVDFVRRFPSERGTMRFIQQLIVAAVS